MGEVSEDAQLVAAVRNGDRAAFGLLYEKHARMIHGVLLAHVPHADADDLVQDVFLAALRKLGSLREPAEMEFAAALITMEGSQNEHQEHVQKAMAGAKGNPLLSENLANQFSKMARN